VNAFRKLLLASAATLILVGAGCSKKAAVNTPPPPPPSHENTTQPTQRRETATASRPSNSSTASSTPASRYPDAATRARIDQLLARIEDAYFDYDKATLRPDAVKALEKDSSELRDILKDFPDYKLTIEGHCDERGSAEYNMALGDKRADAAKEYLVNVGIPAQQLAVVSFGKEHPVCEEHDEACWQRNRRIHIVAMAKN